MSVFVIAEAGVNHNGSVELALEMIEAAKQCGADAVKFQSFSADKLVMKGAEKAEYQKRETGEDDQHSMLKQLEMSPSMHVRLVDHCWTIGIEFMSTPFDEEASQYLVSLGMARIKVSSAEITNHPFLEFLAVFDVPLILSTGMASLDEVVEAVEVIRRVRQQRGYSRQLSDALSLLHCTSNYPAKLCDVNLRAMLTMRDEIGVPVGYSDHTNGILIAAAAVAMGATVIEKHFTLDRTMPGPDHKASLEPGEFSEMVKQIREVEQALGSGEKLPMVSELPIRDLVRRSIVLGRSMNRGDSVTMEDIAILRPGNGIPPKDVYRVLGMKLIKPMTAGEMLRWEDLE